MFFDTIVLSFVKFYDRYCRGHSKGRSIVQFSLFFDYSEVSLLRSYQSARLVCIDEVIVRMRGASVSFVVTELGGLYLDFSEL